MPGGGALVSAYVRSAARSDEEQAAQLISITGASAREKSLARADQVHHPDARRHTVFTVSSHE